MKRRKIKIHRLLIVLLIPITLISTILFLLLFHPIAKDIQISLNEDHIAVSYEATYKKGYSCSTDKENWIEAEPGTCLFAYSDQPETFYLKRGKKVIELGNNLNQALVEISTREDVIYVPVNGSYKLEPIADIKGYTDQTISYTSKDPEILVDENGEITADQNYESEITISLLNEEYTIPVIATDLFVPIRESYDFTRPYLTGKDYTKEENDLLDQILFQKISLAGDKTRAGVLTAARFLTLEFPRRVNYFFENGRQGWNVDGEGRYYHKGLYLDESRFEGLINSSVTPGPWGSNIYSRPAEENMENGLDCSGFVTWAIYNGGFDVGDIGAGITSGYDLCDTGDMQINSMELVESGKIKAGDLVHDYELSAHIGMIIGIDENYFYVAQSLWYDETGVIISTYDKETFVSHWPEVILMDDVYIEDGNYTAMW